MIRACDAKRGTLRRQEGDANISSRKEEECPRQDGWTAWEMISKRRDCRGKKCTTMLHGGVYPHTSTTHESRTKMKKK